MNASLVPTGGWFANSGWIPLAMLWVALGSSQFVRAAETTQIAIAAIHDVGAAGEGNLAAGKAWRQLAGLEAAAIPEILAGMDTANDLAANYLRSAVDAIAERESAAGKALPLAELESFLGNTQHHPRARRLAYELIRRASPQTAARLLPEFVDDPSTELRRDAVAGLIVQAEQQRATGESSAAIRRFRQALGFARDEAQIKNIAGQLRDLGQSVDLPRHFGFLTHWHVIGPFDNTRLVGFEQVFPPEQEIDLTAEYVGKSHEGAANAGTGNADAPNIVRWVPAHTGDAYGMLDINAVCGEHKEAVAYALAQFESSEARQAEVRLGCKNGWKIWVNGNFLFGREEYHRGSRIDQYRLPIELRAGTNQILLKVCQNELVEDWTKQWEFQLRVCDAAGTAILADNRLPTPDSKGTEVAK